MTKPVTKTVRHLLEEAIRDDQGWCALHTVVDDSEEFTEELGANPFNTEYKRFDGVLSAHPIKGLYEVVQGQPIGYGALSFRGSLVGMLTFDFDAPTAVDWVSMEAYRDAMTFLRLINTAVPIDNERFVGVIENLNQAVEVNND